MARLRERSRAHPHGSAQACPDGGERSLRRGRLRHYRPSCVPPTSKPSTCTGKNSNTSSAAAWAPVPLRGVLTSLTVYEVLWLAGCSATWLSPWPATPSMHPLRTVTGPQAGWLAALVLLMLR